MKQINISATEVIVMELHCSNVKITSLDNVIFSENFDNINDMRQALFSIGHERFDTFKFFTILKKEYISFYYRGENHSNLISKGSFDRNSKAVEAVVECLTTIDSEEFKDLYFQSFENGVIPAPNPFSW